MAARLDWATAHPKDAKEVLERRGVDAVILITYHRGVPSAVVAGRTPGLTSRHNQ